MYRQIHRVLNFAHTLCVHVPCNCDNKQGSSTFPLRHREHNAGLWSLVRCEMNLYTKCRLRLVFRGGFFLP